MIICCRHECILYAVRIIARARFTSFSCYVDNPVFIPLPGKRSPACLFPGLTERNGDLLHVWIVLAMSHTVLR